MPDTETTHTTLDLPFSVWCLCEMIDRGAGRLSCLCRVHCHCPVEHRDFPPSPFLTFFQVFLAKYLQGTIKAMILSLLIT